MTTDTAIADVKRVRMEPGDVLAFRLEKVWPNDDLERLYDRLMAAFGEDAPIIIVGPGVDLEIINSEDLKRG